MEFTSQGISGLLSPVGLLALVAIIGGFLLLFFCMKKIRTDKRTDWQVSISVPMLILAVVLWVIAALLILFAWTF